MSISNDSNLINQICVQSGLQGKELELLKQRLEKLSKAELNNELTRLLAGNNLAVDTGLTVEREVSAQSQNPENAAQIEIDEQQCKEAACQIIDENLRDAFNILNSQHLGSISGAYDNAKDDNDKLKTSNVSKVIDYQKAGLTQIIEAKNKNLTRREYYQENKQRIKDMILTRLNVLKTPTGVSYFDSVRGNYSRDELVRMIDRYIESFCSKASIEDLKRIQQGFVSYDSAVETDALERFVKNAKDYTENYQASTFIQEGKLINIEKGIIPEYWDSDELITFEEVYKLERGTEYSKQEMEQYIQAKAEMETVVNAYNKKQQFVDFAKDLRNEDISYSEKEEKLLAGFAGYYTLSDDGGLSRIQEIIDRYKMPIIIEDGKLNLDAYATETAKVNALNSLLKMAEQEKEKEFKTFLGDKTIEEYQSSFEKKADTALGEENSKMLAQAMMNDNSTVIQRYTGNTAMTGMALTVVGGVLCFTPAAPLGAALMTAGNTLAIGGMVAKTGLGAADYATKDVQTTEELEDLAKDFVMDAGGFIIGMKAGQTGIKAFKKLIDKKLAATFGEEISQGNRIKALKTVFADPENLKNFATAAGVKIGTDFLISYAGDLAMMGVLDTHDDWKSLLQANLVGVMVGTSGDVKDAAGVSKAGVKQYDSTPRGLAANEIEAVQRAKNQNPAEVVAEKVKQEWQQADINTRVEEESIDLFKLDPEAGLHQPAPEVNGEVSSLIFTGQLKEVLTQRYDEMSNVFKDIAQNRSDDFKKLAQKKDKQVFANGIVKILAEEMGLKGVEPKIEFDATGNADGLADWTTGTIIINNEVGNAKQLVEMISHEFQHMLQYRDILAQYGEQGLREIIMNDKEIPADKKEAEIKKVLESDYTKKLLDNFNELQHSKEGSLNEYITRIYKEEFANPIKPDEDINGYTNQTTEREAYHLGSEQLGNNTEGLDNVSIEENAFLKAKARILAQLQSGEGLQSQHLERATSAEAKSDYFIDEYGQIRRNVPAGISNIKNITSAAYKMLTKKKLPINSIVDIIRSINEDNIEIAHKLIDDDKHNFTVKEIRSILDYTNKEDSNIEIVHKLIDDDKHNFTGWEIQSILDYTNKDSIEIVHKLIDDNKHNFRRGEIASFLSRTNKDNIEVANKMVDAIIDGKKLPSDQIYGILQCTTKDNTKVANKMVDAIIDGEKLSYEQIADILKYTTKDNKDVAYKLIDNKDFTKLPINEIDRILMSTTEYNKDFACKLIDNKKFSRWIISSTLDDTTKDNIDVAHKMIDDKEFPRDQIGNILYSTTKYNIDVAHKMIDDKEFPRKQIAYLLEHTTKDNIDVAHKMIDDKEFPRKQIDSILYNTTKNNKDVAYKMIDNKEFPRDQIHSILRCTTKDNKDVAYKLIDDKEFPRDKIIYVLERANNDSKSLINAILSHKDIKNSILPDVVERILCKDSVNNGKVDTNKVKRYTSLLENPKTSGFMIKKLNEGMDINTAAFLCKTQQKLNIENAQTAQGHKKSQIEGLTPEQYTAYETFTRMGLNEKQVKAVLKAISSDDGINNEMQAKAIELVNLKVQENKIGDILAA